MKKVKLTLLIFLLLLLVGCEKKEKHLYEELLAKTEKQEILVNEYTIYGKHLNISGNIPNENNSYSLVLKNDEFEKEYELFLEDKKFSLTEYINKGLNLDNVLAGSYLFLLKEKNNDGIKYYNLVNNTKYENLEYYTISNENKNNLIKIGYDNYNEYHYMYLECKEEKLPEEVYDVIIDPGHGGNDSGAVNGQHNENSINLSYGLMLKDALEKEGLKVKMTRETLDGIKHYGAGSRTAIPYEAKAKLMLSLHLNSGNTYNTDGGVEIYTAYGDDISFAEKLAKNIVDNTSTNYSVNAYYRVAKGVYKRVYSEEDKNDSKKKAIKEGWEPYDIKPNTTYYYFIRETGGIITNAFADGRNPSYEANPYYDSNYGVEAYLIELGYISNKKNLQIILDEKEKYVEGIKQSILEYIKEDL